MAVLVIRTQSQAEQINLDHIVTVLRVSALNEDRDGGSPERLTLTTSNGRQWHFEGEQARRVAQQLDLHFLENEGFAASVKQ